MYFCEMYPTCMSSKLCEFICSDFGVKDASQMFASGSEFTNTTSLNKIWSYFMARYQITFTNHLDHDHEREEEHLSWRAEGLSAITSAASLKARDAFCSPSAAITCPSNHHSPSQKTKTKKSAVITWFVEHHKKYHRSSQRTPVTSTFSLVILKSS